MDNGRCECCCHGDLVMLVVVEWTGVDSQLSSSMIFSSHMYVRTQKHRLFPIILFKLGLNTTPSYKKNTKNTYFIVLFDLLKKQDK